MSRRRHTRGPLRRRTALGPFTVALVLLVALPALALDPGDGLWETRAKSGSARQELSYVAANGSMFLAGGGTRHQRYDPVRNDWRDVAPLPAALDHIQGVTVDGRIYYVGGLRGWPAPHVDTVYKYDPATDRFTTKARMPRGRGAGGVAVHDGRIYYAGGLADGVAVPWFDVYDPATDTWKQLPPMPTARDHFHAVVMDGRFWAIGGRNREIRATTSANEAYDLASGRWTTGHAPLPTPRGGFAAAGVGHEILIFGGESYGKAHDEVEAYDIGRDSWRALNRMPLARHGMQAAMCNDAVYLAGGGTRPGHAPIDLHEAFHPGGIARPCSEDGGAPAPTPTPVAGTVPPPEVPGAQPPGSQMPSASPSGTDQAADPGKEVPSGDPRPEIRELSVSRRRGRLRVRVDLSERATVEVRLQRAIRGRLVARRCRPSTRRRAHRRSCIRYVGVPAATVVAQRSAGPHVIRMAVGRLRPGRYRCVAVATGTSGRRSPAVHASLRIVRPRR